ncbi:hypothetical protein VJ923_05505 [Adlercreutzia sp. R25]|uniref:Type IV toxin-antitoxin system AbiEi family antitoxin domain-containing protein n=1 Tax=Adlercreutzia shanghongiae TaxID=3111773 RepID=A0ABU6IY00_9ACTN|nr:MULTISPECIES: hypothetical protein [unclassified Adlercreutzia]MEC4272612.1 hypothetical protein [Adlercreutzia sp. R25]MEC4294487.1 hypothetical protein [Adlercreutzia sp. R22]
MKLYEADKALSMHANGKRAFRTTDLALVFAEGGTKLRSTISRLVKAGSLWHIARDLYWYASAGASDIPAIEELAVALRPGEMNFIGMESAASLWSVISQIPVGRLTVVTTGKEGEFNTPFGVIEFVHTSRDWAYLLDHTVDYPGHGLRLATKDHTVRGLLRSGRSLDLIDWEEVEDDE